MKSAPKPARRSRAAVHTGTIGSALDDVGSVVEELKDEMQAWYDALPENLQQSEKASEIETATSELEDIYSEIDNADSGLQDLSEGLRAKEFTYTQDERRSARSRADRLSNAQGVVDGLLNALTRLKNEAEAEDLSDLAAQIHEVCQDLDTVTGSMANVSFPGMY